MPIIPAQLLGNQGIQPASGYPLYSNDWPASGAFPQSFSAGGWTVQARNIQQQTFLGASIVRFGMNGGFGDNSSTLSVELVEDEYNVSDLTPAGQGDDPYHSGIIGDKFVPPIVGSPVYFKFGENFATIEEAYKQTFDDLYGYKTGNISDPEFTGTYDIDKFQTLPDNSYVDIEKNIIQNWSQRLSDEQRGRNHIVFGGILQSYVQNKGPGGSPVYSVQVVDPREILSNVTLILDNYTGPTFNSHNILNIYGFLEYNANDNLLAEISGANPFNYTLQRYIAAISGEPVILYSGDDTHRRYNPWLPTPQVPEPVNVGNISPVFPITGTGFSRRNSQGIPFYRIKQAINSLMEYDGLLPDQYKVFGGKINFRGFNYVVDFGTLPNIQDLYYLNFDQMTLLDLVTEICDITSKDLFVTLLPVINHPACSFLNSWNKRLLTTSMGDPNKLFSISGIAGIIRIDTIDRSKQPEYGSIKKYLDNISASGIHVENQDLGYELSNITTDKFITGAQEVENYFFTTQCDRDTLDALNQKVGNTPILSKADKWKLETSFKQQLLPYYGLLGNKAVTIPIGFGAYQQILLDTTGLNANGVGSYYVATEMELRCALISFDRWKEFLLQYNDIYLESIEENDLTEEGTLVRASAPPGHPPVNRISNNYAVTVPRSVFPSYSVIAYGIDKLPFSPCNPPYGYPLYYKRATKIGIPEAGLTSISSRLTSVINSFSLLSSSNESNYKAILDSEWSRLKNIKESELSTFEIEYLKRIKNIIDSSEKQEDITKAIFLIEDFLSANKQVFSALSKNAKKNTENALKVYNFIKSIAEECLGKKFLVKIPQSTNLAYADYIQTRIDSFAYSNGPFGFKPRPVYSTYTLPGYEFTQEFDAEVKQKFSLAKAEASPCHDMAIYLNSGVLEYFQGSLKTNYDPIEDKHEFNYEPTNLGGFFNFNICANLLNASGLNTIKTKYGYNKLPSGIFNGLIPLDMTNFINENGRISAYVRFDNSQYISFENFNTADFTQEIVLAHHRITDLCEQLDNIKKEDYSSFTFPPVPENKKQQQITFVKCQVDEELYMPPKTKYEKIVVHGREISPIETFIPPRRIYDPCKDTYNDSFSFYRTVYIPLPADSGRGYSSTVLLFDSFQFYNQKIIKTDLENLDTKNVYALITLPSRAIPTLDARYRDSTFQTLNTERFKHFMTMDTVDSELPGFDKPAILGSPTTIVKDIGCAASTSNSAADYAWFAAKKALSNLSFSFPNQVNFSSPSPVYPDLISLPLMSKERCYGPWVSSHLDFKSAVYSNVGGKIEFIKDENLAPWNYNGYQLMNEAALTQAEFAHSLLLFSERGGFVVPGVPPNVSLGKSLLKLGPLVTNLEVDVSTGGIKTTVKLDLYTSSFGKLQKQKQDEISKLSRERQKLRDERNRLLRNGGIKAQSNKNYFIEYQSMNKSITNGSNNSSFNGGKNSAIGNIVMGVKKYTDSGWSSDQPKDKPTHERKTYVYEGTIQKINDFGQTSQNFISQIDLAQSYYNTASSSIDEMYLPASMLPDHANMPSNILSYDDSRKNMYFTEETPFDPKDVV